MGDENKIQGRATPEKGISVTYNTYEIASYAQGYTEFIIPYENTISLLEFN